MCILSPRSHQKCSFHFDVRTWHLFSLSAVDVSHFVQYHFCTLYSSCQRLKQDNCKALFTYMFWMSSIFDIQLKSCEMSDPFTLSHECDDCFLIRMRLRPFIIPKQICGDKCLKFRFVLLHFMVELKHSRIAISCAH